VTHQVFSRKGTLKLLVMPFSRKEREDACQDALFFFNNAIPFNVANNEEFRRMLELVAKHGVGFKPLSYHEISVKYLKQQVEKANLILEEHKLFWKKNGCTIMIDRWTDRRRTILNFLVNESYPRKSYSLHNFPNKIVNISKSKIVEPKFSNEEYQQYLRLKSNNLAQSSTNPSLLTTCIYNI